MKLRQVHRPLPALMLAAAAAAVMVMSGCGGSGGDGSVRVMLTDLPMSEVSEVYVHIVRIEMVTQSAGVQTLLTDGQMPDEIELTALAANPLLLGQPLVPPGTYTQVRLIVSEVEGENWIVTEDEERHDLKIPSGPQTGTKLVTGQFEIAAGQVVTLLLDFNAAASVHEAGTGGQWIMRPTVAASVVPQAQLDFGTIEGTVLDDQGEPLAVPEGQVLGVFIETPFGPIALAEVIADDGSFAIPALIVGDYELRVMFADTDWSPIGDPLSFQIDGGDLIALFDISLNANETIQITIVVP